MTRRIVPITPDLMVGRGGPCATCVAWECTPADARRLEGLDDDRSQEKRAWLSTVLREWGSCGRVALVDDVVVGHLLYAPAALVPGADRFPTAPVSPDAVLLTVLRVDEGHTGGGLGRMLVQGMARDLIDRGGLRAVEAFADVAGTASCVPPAGFLGRVGFATWREHPVRPRMRMDLRSALRWRDEVEAAVERLRGAVRPVGQRQPGPARSSD